MKIRRRLIKNKVVALVLVAISTLPIIFERDITFFVVIAPLAVLLFISKKNHIA